MTALLDVAKTATTAEELEKIMSAILRLADEERKKSDMSDAWQEAKRKFHELPVADMVKMYTSLVWDSSQKNDNYLYHLCEEVLSTIGFTGVLRSNWSRSLFDHISGCDYIIRQLQHRCDTLERRGPRVGRKPTTPRPEKPPAEITGMRPSKHVCDAIVQLAYLEYERSLKFQPTSKST